MGATFFVVASIERPDILAKVKSFIGLGPAVFNYHARAIPLQIFNYLQHSMKVN